MDSTTTTAIRALVVSDIHRAVKVLASVATEIRALDPPVDIIFVLGDFTDVSTEDQADAGKISVAEGEISSMLSTLQTVHRRVVYVPGNHDPITTFALDSPPDLSPYCYNVHNMRLQLLPGLSVVGFGGSVPAYRNGEQVWGGFPYDEEQMYTGVKRVLEMKPSADASAETGSGAGVGAGAGDESSKAGDAEDEEAVPEQLILLTHVGPHGVATTVDGSDVTQAPIQAGSTSIRKLLAKSSSQSRVLLNLHGHVHSSPGQAWLGEVRVVNPGSIRYGNNFSVIDLKRGSVSDAWHVHNVQLRRL